jgi:hypothetical protein
VTSFFPEPGPEPADRPAIPAFPAGPAEAAAPADAEGNGFRTALPAPRPVAAPASRWAKSDVTFGPVGRVVCTLLLVAVGVWFLAVSVFGLVGGALWWLIVTPWALRDLWRPVSRNRP